MARFLIGGGFVETRLVLYRMLGQTDLSRGFYEILWDSMPTLLAGSRRFLMDLHTGLYSKLFPRRLHLSKMYIMSQSLLSYFRIDTPLPSAPTSETDDDTSVKPGVTGVGSDVSPPIWLWCSCALQLIVCAPTSGSTTKPAPPPPPPRDKDSGVEVGSGPKKKVVSKEIRLVVGRV